MNKKYFIQKMKEYFGADEKRIAHALKVLSYAEEIQEEEHGDLDVLTLAAIFHDIGIHEAQRKYGSTAGHYQEREGPAIAERILREAGVEERIITEVSHIIAHHHTRGEVETLNFKILWDADWLVNLKDEFDCSKKDELGRIIDRIFLTSTGRAMAKKIYLGGYQDTQLFT